MSPFGDPWNNFHFLYRDSNPRTSNQSQVFEPATLQHRDSFSTRAPLFYLYLTSPVFFSYLYFNLFLLHQKNIHVSAFRESFLTGRELRSCCCCFRTPCCVCCWPCRCCLCCFQTPYCVCSWSCRCCCCCCRSCCCCVGQLLNMCSLQLNWLSPPCPGLLNYLANWRLTVRSISIFDEHHLSYQAQTDRLLWLICYSSATRQLTLYFCVQKPTFYVCDFEGWTPSWDTKSQYLWATLKVWQLQPPSLE